MTIHRRALIRNIFMAASATCAGPSFISKSIASLAEDSPILLTNQFLELHFVRQGNRVGLFKLVNRLSGRSTVIPSDDFCIGIAGEDALTAKDFIFRNLLEHRTGDSDVLQFHFEHHSKNIQLIIEYRLGMQDFFARRQLALTTALPLRLMQTDVWQLRLEGRCQFQENHPPGQPTPAFGFKGTKGYGAPVLMEDGFFGLEYPAGYNQYSDGLLSLSHFPGKEIRGEFKTKIAVVGVAESNAANRWFERYIGSLLATPHNQRPLFINFNTWTTLDHPTEKACLELIAVFRKKLFKPYGVAFDSFVIDDGWDNKNGFWDLNKERFPAGFSSLLRALQPTQTRLGLWLSPSSGFGHAAWMAAQGYPRNGTWDWFICQSDPRYRANLNKTVDELTKTNAINFFKLDGYCAICNTKSHPNHLPGNFSKEANVDAFIDLLTAIRKAQPDVFLDPTDGLWLSPWWLQYVDSVYGELYDGVPPAIAPTPVPGYGHFISRDALFRDRLKDNPGFPANAIEHLGVYTPDYATLYDEIMAVIGRGGRLLSLYLNHQELLKQEDDWKFLAHALQWARKNAAVFLHTQKILGEPLRLEPYGYAHFDKDEGIIALYNPFIESRTVQVSLDAQSGWIHTAALKSNADRPFTASVIYPYQQVLQPDLRYGQSLSVLLAGHEVLIVRVGPVNHENPILTGARYLETGRHGNSIEYQVFGRPGSVRTLFLTSQASAGFRGDRTEVNKKTQTTLITFPGREQQITVSDNSVRLLENEGQYQLKGTCTATIPGNAVAEMHILFVPVFPSGYKPLARVSINGQPVEHRLSYPDLNPPHMRLFAELPMTDWAYISFAVPQGKNNISFFIDAPLYASQQFRAEVGCWLWVDHELVTVPVTVDCSGSAEWPVPEILPVPARIQTEREIITVIRKQFFTAGDQAVSAQALAVYLDELLPDAVAMSRGQLQLNKSVGGKNLIIAGQQYNKGIGMQAYGRIQYDIEGKSFSRFRAMAGFDGNGGDGTVVFEVRIDGKKVFASIPLHKKDPGQEINVDVSHAASLELRVLNGIDSDDVNGLCANWCEARLLR